MAITLVQSRLTSTALAPPWTLAFTSPVTAGNLLVAAIATNGSRAATLTDSLGQTWTRAGSYSSGSTCELSIWYVLTTLGGALTLSFNEIAPSSVSALSFVIAEYTNDTPQLAALISSAQVGNVASTHPSPGAITASAGQLVVTAYGQGAANQSAPTIAAPFVIRQAEPDGLTKEAIGFADATATGTMTPVFTLSSSTNWTCAGACFAVGGPTPAPVPVPAPEPTATPAQDPAPQVTQSGRVVTLYAVQGGNVYVAPVGGSSWTAATNSTGSKLIVSGVVRSACNQQKVWFADGTNYLYYDPSDNAMHAWTASAGSLPTDSDGTTPRLICTWRGRTVLSGLLGDSQNWFMSAVDDPTNFSYFPVPDVVTKAVAGNNSTLGMIGDVVTCLIPYSDDTLIVGGDSTIWQIQGDPAAGGSIMRISDAIGMAWGNPWAKDPYGTLYFVSNHTGIYQMQPGQAPLRISQPIEQFLRNINTGRTIIRCLWNDDQQGLHVFVSYVAGQTGTVHFFWEYRTGSWWTDTFRQTAHNPIAVVTFDGNSPQDRRALLGGWDGYVRMLDRDATEDDGIEIDSTVVLGPLLTQDMDEVLPKFIQATLGESSGSVDYAIHVGATAEAALASEAVASGTWGAGRSYNDPVRFAGHAVWIKLTSADAWALEAVRVHLRPESGRIRKRGKG